MAMLLLNACKSTLIRDVDTLAGCHILEHRTGSTGHETGKAEFLEQFLHRYTTPTTS